MLEYNLGIMDTHQDLCASASEGLLETHRRQNLFSDNLTQSICNYVFSSAATFNQELVASTQLLNAPSRTNCAETSQQGITLLIPMEDDDGLSSESSEKSDSDVRVDPNALCFIRGRVYLIPKRELEKRKMFNKRQLNDLKPWREMETLLRILEIQDIEKRNDQKTERTTKNMNGVYAATPYFVEESRNVDD